MLLDFSFLKPHLIVTRNLVFTSSIPLGSSPIGLEDFCVSRSAANQVFAQSFFNQSEAFACARHCLPFVSVPSCYWTFLACYVVCFDWLNCLPKERLRRRLGMATY